MSCMNFQMIQAKIKCFERSTVERIEENSNDASCCLFIRLVVSMVKSSAASEVYVEDVFLSFRKYYEGIVNMSY